MEYTKELDLKSVRISYTDLQRVFSRVDSLLEKTNPQVRPYRKNLSVGGRSNRYSLEGDLNIEKIKNALPNSYELDFEYMAGDKASISRIRLEFNDTYRTVRISGTDIESVEVMSSTIKDAFEPYTTPIGGSGFRSATGTTLWIIPILCFTLEKYGNLSIPKWISYFVAIASLTPLVAMSIDHLLPGAFFFQEGSSWYEKNSALLGVIGFGMAIIAFLPTIEWIITKLK